MAKPLEINEVIPPAVLKKAAEGNDGVLYVPVPESAFAGIIKNFAEKGMVLISLFCEQAPDRTFILFYVFERRGQRQLIVLVRQLGGSATSIVKEFASASWFEREVTDGFGVTFDGSPDTRRLFLHECYPEGFHPLLKSFKNQPLQLKGRTPEYEFKVMDGEGVYQIPVGPVHAGIIEPGHFRFSVIGETIFNLEVRMFWKHRGIEKLAEGKTPDECVAIAEAISGDESVANSVAFASACERISGTRVPKRALHLRTVLLELERMYAHLNDLAGMAVDVAYPVGAMPFFVLREELLRLNNQLTGSRFMKGIVATGGLQRDILPEALDTLAKYLPSFTTRFTGAVEEIRATSLVLDRFATTGVIKQELIAPLNITGPAARASGVRIDTRADHPYGIYDELQVTPQLQADGDVLARFNVKAEEVLVSAAIVRRLLRAMPSGSVRAKYAPADGYAISLVEASRGQSLHFVHIRRGVIYRYKARTPSFCNWQAIQHAVLGNIVPDFPLINKSLNLSYAGTDL
jgi:Ni,Fe-hydrogenase III large subunit/Ni,Fe-hydrogenase III component G